MGIERDMLEGHRQEYEAKYQQKMLELQQLEHAYQHQHEVLKEAVNVLAGAIQAVDRLMKQQEELEAQEAAPAERRLLQEKQDYEEKYGFNEL